MSMISIETGDYRQYTEHTKCSIIYVFPKNNRTEYLAEFVKDMFLDQDIPYSLVPAHLGSSRITIVGNKLRQVVNCLYHKGKIHPTDRADIESMIKEFEKIEERKKLIISEIGTAQEDSFKMILSSYVEGILDGVPQLSLAIRVLHYALRKSHPMYDPTKPDNIKGALYYFQESISKEGFVGEFTDHVPDESKQIEIGECLIYISKIYHNDMNLSDMLVQLGGSLPIIKLQNDFILKFIIQEVIKKVGDNSSLISEIKNLLVEINKKRKENGYQAICSMLSDSKNYTPEDFEDGVCLKLLAEISAIVPDLTSSVTSTSESEPDMNTRPSKIHQRPESLIDNEAPILFMSSSSSFTCSQSVPPLDLSNTIPPSQNESDNDTSEEESFRKERAKRDRPG